MRDYEDGLPVSDAIAGKFQYGFPRNWLQLVQAILIKEEERRYVFTGF